MITSIFYIFPYKFEKAFVSYSHPFSTIRRRVKRGVLGIEPEMPRVDVKLLYLSGLRRFPRKPRIPLITTPKFTSQKYNRNINWRLPGYYFLQIFHLFLSFCFQVWQHNLNVRSPPARNICDISIIKLCSDRSPSAFYRNPFHGSGSGKWIKHYIARS